ncbi:hypothetical protein ES703_102807 [subsurface metagenome]
MAVTSLTLKFGLKKSSDFSRRGNPRQGVFSPSEFRSGAIHNHKKSGKFGVNFGSQVGFQGKNWGWGVKLQRLGKTGTIETFENV